MPKDFILSGGDARTDPLADYTTEELDGLHLWLAAPLRDIADRFGNSVALLVAERIGGETVTMPKRASPEHPVAAAAGEVGMDVLGLLMETHDKYAKVLIPTAERARVQLRNHRIEAMKKQGHNTNHIARAFKLNRRTIQLVCQSMRLRDAGDPGARYAFPQLPKAASTALPAPKGAAGGHVGR